VRGTGNLGDRHAVYGFSGMTRKRCETYRIKVFEDAYGDGIKAKDFTRMGVAIRHLTGNLSGVEAKRSGIHPFCITIGKQGQDYLPHMYGAVNYTIVGEVEQLPYKVSEIYRRLTA
jgi:nitric oxide reductase NorD protein